jgi:GntR family transcriptional regulator/MocR family aminotransferase
VDLHVTPGSISFFVRGPEDLNVHDVVAEAARRGVLIEPADTYFAGADAPRNVFRMGVTSLPLEKIRPGVSALATVIRDMTSREKERLEEATGRWLRGEDLRSAIENHTYLYQGVYGRPHRFQLSPDGTMSGHAGYANEDRDTGVWWVENDRWFRRWSRWAYGEVQGFYVVVDGDEIKWFNAKGKMVDRAVVAAAEVEEPVD